MAGGTAAVRQILELPVDRIDQADQRLTPLHHPTVAKLAALMAKDGQKTPIEVCQLPERDDFFLVCGAHRLAAVRMLKWPTIDGFKVGADAIERRTRELHENFSHRTLNALDQASSVVEFCELVRTTAVRDGSRSPTSPPKTLKNEADDESLNLRLRYGWADDVAELIGVSRAGVYRALALRRNLIPAIAEAVRPDPIADNAQALYALSKLTAAQQLKIAANMAGGMTAAMAIDLVVGRKLIDGAQKAHDAFVGSWGRMTGRKQAEALETLSKIARQSGWELTFRRLGAK
ncbi:MAG TPA: ParB N-terminal domain-containing protein [Caulobacteraceae bacterium]|jgi:hypothetical protein